MGLRKGVSFKMKVIKKLILAVCALLLFSQALFLLINVRVRRYAEPFILDDAGAVPRSYACIVLGAAVYGKKRMSRVLLDRMNTALSLYRSGKVRKFIVTGDHGKVYYDEVNLMKDFLLKNGISKENIFLDHAGFNTYNSMVRAKKIFRVSDCVVVTQRFHLPRAIYIARKNGLTAVGLAADRRQYRYRRRYAVREYFAVVKAFFDVLTGQEPRFLGEAYPVTGSGIKTWDR